MTNELKKRIVDLRGKLPLHKSRRYKTRSLMAIISIAIHHSLTTVGDAFSFNDYHVKKNNWPAIGYAFVILKNGTIQWCQDLTNISYHVGNSNKKALGICLVGDFRKEDPTNEQIQSVHYLLEYLQEYLPNEMAIKGHQEYPGYSWKTCPGFDMDQFRKNYTAWKVSDSNMNLQERVERIEKALFGKVYQPPVCEYEKMRFKNDDGIRGTDVHIFKSSKPPELVLGQFGKREYLDDLAKFYNAKVAINAGFFDMDSKVNEHLGLLVTNNGTGAEVAGWYQSPDKNFIDVVARKDGKVTIEKRNGYDGKYLKDIQLNALWGGSAAYILVKNSEKSNLNWDVHKSLIKQHANRTMLGQDKHGIWHLIVADGRTANDKGLNAEEQVRLCLDLHLQWAVNLDGGGSSEMYKEGKIISSNYRCDRKIGTAYIIR